MSSCWRHSLLSQTIHHAFNIGRSWVNYSLHEMYEFVQLSRHCSCNTYIEAFFCPTTAYWERPADAAFMMQKNAMIFHCGFYRNTLLSNDPKEAVPSFVLHVCIAYNRTIWSNLDVRAFAVPYEYVIKHGILFNQEATNNKQHSTVLSSTWLASIQQSKLLWKACMVWYMSLFEAMMHWSKGYHVNDSDLHGFHNRKFWTAFNIMPLNSAENYCKCSSVNSLALAIREMVCKIQNIRNNWIALEDWIIYSVAWFFHCEKQFIYVYVRSLPAILVNYIYRTCLRNGYTLSRFFMYWDELLPDNSAKTLLVLDLLPNFLRHHQHQEHKRRPLQKLHYRLMLLTICQIQHRPMKLACSYSLAGIDAQAVLLRSGLFFHWGDIKWKFPFERFWACAQ